ncbi:MAG: agmatine deiminase family protein [Candidatus Calescibacterium sp.]|nr:agmatine deiminase family protein [Candidatus Calescibacterium sp.]
MFKIVNENFSRSDGIKRLSEIGSEVSSEKNISSEKIGYQSNTTDVFKGNYILPENAGEIKKMVMSYDVRITEKMKKEYFEALKTLLKEIPGKIYVVVNSESYQELYNQISSKIDNEMLNRVVIIKSDIYPSIWARDSIQVFVNYNQKNEEVTVAKPDRTYYPSPYDSMVYKIVAENTGSKFTELQKFAIDGGNTIATKNYIFIGIDSIRESMLKGLGRLENGQTSLDKAKQEFIRFFDENFPNQKLFIVGDNKQPVFHIDMFLTILRDDDEKVALLGNPDLSLEMLNDSEYDTSKYNKFDIEKFKEDATYFADQHREELKKIKEKLEKEGFKVIDVPIVIPRGPGIFMTYNNMLFSGNRAFVPKYGMEKMDSFVQNILKENGFEPIPIDVTNITTWMGAIHCITNVIDRYDTEKSV